MTRTAFLGLATIVLALALGTGAFAQHSATPESNGELRFDIQFRDTLLTASDAQLTLGDRFILNDLVLLNGEEVGHNGGVCTVTDTAGELVCAVTWSLPNGTISTQFLNTPAPDKSFAVVGGTGDYANADGTGELVEHGDETGTVTFALAP